MRFADKVVWTAKGREAANRKGQIALSKLERKIYIALQYAVFLGCLIYGCIAPGMARVIPVGVLLFIIGSIVTDFSFVKIEVLYHLYSRGTAYSELLHTAFLGLEETFLDGLKRKSSKHVTGYVRKSGRCFYKKYFAVCRRKENKIEFTLYHNRVRLCVNGEKVILNGGYASTEELIGGIASEIENALNSKGKKYGKI